jgi:hypothetical protein
MYTWMGMKWIADRIEMEDKSRARLPFGVYFYMI